MARPGETAAFFFSGCSVSFSPSVRPQVPRTPSDTLGRGERGVSEAGSVVPVDDAALARCLGRFERRGRGAWTRARSRACPSPRPAGSRRSELAAQSPARLTAAMRARRVARRSRRRGELAARLALLALVALSRLARASDEADASVLVTVSACAPAAPSGALPAAGVRVADANARADETDPRPLLDDDRRPSPFATLSAVLLRVAPWVGGGAQVTLGVNWWNPAGSPAPSPRPRPETHRSRGPTRVVVASIIPRSDVRVVVAEAPPRRSVPRRSDQDRRAFRRRDDRDRPRGDPLPVVVARGVGRRGGVPRRPPLDRARVGVDFVARPEADPRE